MDPRHFLSLVEGYSGSPGDDFELTKSEPFCRTTKLSPAQYQYLKTDPLIVSNVAT
jgi:hypothetical protein